MVRCAYITHQLAKTSEGGAEAQMRWTKRQVTCLRPDYEIIHFDPWTDSIDDFDLVHIFGPTNFPMESARIAAYAKGHGKAVVTSSIFHPYQGGQGLSKAYASLANRLLTGLRGMFLTAPFDRLNPYIWLYRTLADSDLVLPNSRLEMGSLMRHFGLPADRFRVVPNGVNARFATGDLSLFAERYGISDFILWVGRIEPIKNVVGLIESFERSKLDTELVIIGRPADDAYYERCKSIAGDRVRFLPPMPHDSDILASAYAASKVIALPSRYETVGLVALEGALAGANVVITKVGGAREYFGDDAWYVDPGSVTSISRALQDAYRYGRPPYLRQRIMDEFSWEEAGRRTAQAYDEALAMKETMKPELRS